jgi:hypothetical protein
MMPLDRGQPPGSAVQHQELALAQRAAGRLLRAELAYAAAIVDASARADPHRCPPLADAEGLPGQQARQTCKT